MGQFILGALISPAWLLAGLWLQNRWTERREEQAHQRDRERWLMAGRQVAYAELLKGAYRLDSETTELAVEARRLKPGSSSDRFAKGLRTILKLDDELRVAFSVAQIIASNQVRHVARNLILDASGLSPFPGDDRPEQRRAYSERLHELQLKMRADFGLPTTDPLLPPEPG